MIILNKCLVFKLAGLVLTFSLLVLKSKQNVFDIDKNNTNHFLEILEMSL